MYMLLIIYSLFNMNDVSWGTRENPKPVDEKVNTAPQSDHHPKNVLKKVMSFLQSGNEEEDGTVDISFAGLFRCMFCTHPKSSREMEQLQAISVSLMTISDELRGLEMMMNGNLPENVADVSDNDQETENAPRRSVTSNKSNVSDLKDAIMLSIEKTLLPDWLDEEGVRKGNIDSLSDNEEKFWKDLIEKYLQPIEANKLIEAESKAALKNLRDRIIFAFFMFNAIFILIIFLLQLNRNLIFIHWPFGGNTKIVYDETGSEITIQLEYLQLEPIGLAFVFTFGIILVIQFIAMTIHRFSTISQILANTVLDWSWGRKEANSNTVWAEVDHHAVEVAACLQRPKMLWNVEEAEKHNIGRRDTIKKIMKQRENKLDQSNLEENFKREWEDPKMSEYLDFEGTYESHQSIFFIFLDRKTVQSTGLSEAAYSKLDDRRKSQMPQSRPSQMIKKKVDLVIHVVQARINQAFEPDQYDDSPRTPRTANSVHFPINETKF
jgi:chitin synthase